MAKLKMPKRNGIEIVESDNPDDICYAIKKTKTGEYWCITDGWGDSATSFRRFEDANYQFIMIVEEVENG